MLSGSCVACEGYGEEGVADEVVVGVAHFFLLVREHCVERLVVCHFVERPEGHVHVRVFFHRLAEVMFEDRPAGFQGQVALEVSFWGVEEVALYVFFEFFGLEVLSPHVFREVFWVYDDLVDVEEFLVASCAVLAWLDYLREVFELLEYVVDAYACFVFEAVVRVGLLGGFGL